MKPRFIIVTCSTGWCHYKRFRLWFTGDRRRLTARSIAKARTKPWLCEECFAQLQRSKK